MYQVETTLEIWPSVRLGRQLDQTCMDGMRWDGIRGIGVELRHKGEG